MSDNGFSWADDDTLIIDAQPMTAIYLNPKGHVVIRQDRDAMRAEEDQVVIVLPEHIRALIAALREYQPLSVNAARQRRFRARRDQV